MTDTKRNKRKSHESFNVGDLITHKDYNQQTVIYYISKKSRWGDRGQYRFDLTVLNGAGNIKIGRVFTGYLTSRINDRIEYWGWQHTPIGNNTNSVEKSSTDHET